jgi:formate hydrogenlyase subunit 3/multisubunit Na+/H+ antiporter MnhD subunit
MPRGDLLTFLGLVAFAILFAELQYRREASGRWYLLAALLVIASALLVWLAYGS